MARMSKVRRVSLDVARRKDDQIEALKQMVHQRDMLLLDQNKLIDMLKARERALLNYITLKHDPEPEDDTTNTPAR
jgi:hypothetical protein